MNIMDGIKIMVAGCTYPTGSEKELEKRNQGTAVRFSADRLFVGERENKVGLQEEFEAKQQSEKGDRAVIENAKKEMMRLESTYKRLNDKYRKILGILNKCIDLQNAQIDKKALFYVDYLPTAEKPNDKLKISAIRKTENEEEIQRLQKQVNTLEAQISTIKQQHKEKLSQHQNMLMQRSEQREKLWKLYQSYINPKVKIDHTNSHNLYWKPGPYLPYRESDQNQECINQTVTCFTKNNLNSHKNITKINIERPQNDKRRTQFHPSEQSVLPAYEKTYNKTEIMKQEEIKLQIKTLFMMISKQQEFIQASLKQQSHKMKNATVNQIKNRKDGLEVDKDLIRQCLQNECAQGGYTNWLKEEKTFQRFQKQLKQKKQAAQTITTIRDF